MLEGQGQGHFSLCVHRFWHLICWEIICTEMLRREHQSLLASNCQVLASWMPLMASCLKQTHMTLLHCKQHSTSRFYLGRCLAASLVRYHTHMYCLLLPASFHRVLGYGVREMSFCKMLNSFSWDWVLTCLGAVGYWWKLTVFQYRGDFLYPNSCR